MERNIRSLRSRFADELTILCSGAMVHNLSLLGLAFTAGYTALKMVLNQ